MSFRVAFTVMNGLNRMNGAALRAYECLRERRMPYRVRRALTSPVAERLHRPALDALLRLGDRRVPRPISLAQARELHAKYPVRDGYKYDSASKKFRAAERYAELRGMIDLEAVTDVVEVGAGDGQLARCLAECGKSTTILDVTDWRDPDVRADGVNFSCIGTDGHYDLPGESADLVLSYNTLEHIPDPPAAVREMLRITRPGGLVVLSFCPVYNSPFGLHAYRTFYAPYPQFLLAPDALDWFIARNGIHDLGERRDRFQYVNGYGFADYRRAIADLGDMVECMLFRAERDLDHLDVVYRYLPSFWGRGLSFDELTVAYLQIVLVKTDPGRTRYVARVPMAGPLGNQGHR